MTNDRNDAGYIQSSVVLWLCHFFFLLFSYRIIQVNLWGLFIEEFSRLFLSNSSTIADTDFFPFRRKGCMECIIEVSLIVNFSNILFDDGHDQRVFFFIHVISGLLGFVPVTVIDEILERNNNLMMKSVVHMLEVF